MSSVQRATKLLKLKPYKIPVVHALHQPDPNKRLGFCNWVLEGKLWRTGCKRNFFSDEAWFYLHGQVCSQTYRYYSDWKKGASVCEQRQFNAPWNGGQARQGRERQPSVAAPNIWMTLYIMKLFQYSVIHLYSGRERRLSSVNQLSWKICNPLNFKSPTATACNCYVFNMNYIYVLKILKIKCKF